MADNEKVTKEGAGSSPAPKAETPKAEEKKVAPAKAEVETAKEPSMADFVNILAQAMTANNPPGRGEAEAFPLSETIPGGITMYNNRFVDAFGQPIKNLTAEQKKIQEDAQKRAKAQNRRPAPVTADDRDEDEVEL